MTIEATKAKGETLYAYVAVFSGPTMAEFTTAIDRFDDQIANWLVLLPQTVFIVSPMNAGALTDFLRQNVPGIARLLVLDANTDRNGWLPKSGWDFLKHPRRIEVKKKHG